MLEVIEKGSTSECHPVPLLFVHGAWHAAWCWDEHFLGFFADKGYRAVAVSLRGHGTSSTSRPLRTCSIADYVDDVCEVADSLPSTPVLIGHSAGGFVVQKYLESHDAPAAVLVASTPCRGLFLCIIRLMKRHPWLTTKMIVTGKSLPRFNSPRLAREAFFSAKTPESLVLRYTPLLQEESAQVGRDQLLLNLPKPKRVRTPLLVLGAADDACFSPKEVRATARAYGTEAEIFPDMGHDMMLEPGWTAVAARIDTWLGSRGL